MIIANVKPGYYLIINENVVIGKVHRDIVYGGKYPITSYVVKWFNGKTERFTTLSAIALVHDFDNYPGYNSILSR